MHFSLYLWGPLRQLWQEFSEPQLHLPSQTSAKLTSKTQSSRGLTLRGEKVINLHLWVSPLIRYNRHNRHNLLFTRHVQAKTPKQILISPLGDLLPLALLQAD